MLKLTYTQAEVALHPVGGKDAGQQRQEDVEHKNDVTRLWPDLLGMDDIVGAIHGWGEDRNDIEQTEQCIGDPEAGAANGHVELMAYNAEELRHDGFSVQMKV